MELKSFLYLADADRKLIAARRRDSNRLGFALQLTTMRYLVGFLPGRLDPRGACRLSGRTAGCRGAGLRALLYGG
ncbi:DUF4158 domain-containing protein [Nocardia tengchongensis]|uniref:DUF4158 domain-containing protein n=1 Tax=Nocardia tengchongensis TaxID=2055889 RepID=UPI0036ACF330